MIVDKYEAVFSSLLRGVGQEGGDGDGLLVCRNRDVGDVSIIADKFIEYAEKNPHQVKLIKNVYDDGHLIVCQGYRDQEAFTFCSFDYYKQGRVANIDWYDVIIIIYI